MFGQLDGFTHTHTHPLVSDSLYFYFYLRALTVNTEPWTMKRQEFNIFSALMSVSNDVWYARDNCATIANSQVSGLMASPLTPNRNTIQPIRQSLSFQTQPRTASAMPFLYFNTASMAPRRRWTISCIRYTVEFFFFSVLFARCGYVGCSFSVCCESGKMNYPK